MKVLFALLTHRGVLIVLNCIVLAVAGLTTAMAVLREPDALAVGKLVPLVPYVLALLSFGTSRASRAVLWATVAVNTLAGLLALVFLFFLSKNSPSMLAYAAAAMLMFVVPLLNSANAALRATARPAAVHQGGSA